MFSVGSIAMVAGSAWDECNAHDWFHGTVVRRGPTQIKLQFADGPQRFNFTQEELEGHQRRFADTMTIEAIDKYDDFVNEFGEEVALHLIADAMVSIKSEPDCGLAGLCAVAKKETGEDEKDAGP